MYLTKSCSYIILITLTISALPTEDTGFLKCTDEEFKCSNDKCIYKYVLCDGLEDCIDGSDENASMCKTRTCTDQEFRCKNEIGHCIPKNWVCDNWASCNDESDEDRIMCEKWIPNITTTQTPISVSQWPTNEIPFALIPKISKSKTVCGRPNIPKPLIVGGVITSPQKFPWNVAVYKKNERNNFDLICGGTLIASNLVISAAHCFWEHNLWKSKNITDDGKYKIAAGKFTRDIAKKDYHFTQISDVKFVYIEQDYYDLPGNYANDIAIVVLPIGVSLGLFVMPICVDWTKEYSIENGAVGKVAGWGLTEKNISSPVLLEASFNYSDRLKCRPYFPEEFQQWLSPKDKFCASSTMGSIGQNVDSGDSGAGFIIEHKNSHFLTGIVSLKHKNPSESIRNIAVFTDVYFHIGWINTFYKNYADD